MYLLSLLLSTTILFRLATPAALPEANKYAAPIGTINGLDYLEIDPTMNGGPGEGLGGPFHQDITQYIDAIKTSPGTIQIPIVLGGINGVLPRKVGDARFKGEITCEATENSANTKDVETMQIDLSSIRNSWCCINRKEADGCTVVYHADSAGVSMCNIGPAEGQKGNIGIDGRVCFSCELATYASEMVAKKCSSNGKAAGTMTYSGVISFRVQEYNPPPKKCTWTQAGCAEWAP